MKTRKIIEEKLRTRTGGWLSTDKFPVMSFIKLIPALLLIPLLDGCSPCYYSPSAHNVPLFKEQGDARLSGSFKLSPRSIGADVQMGVAITDYLGIVAGYSYFTGSPSLLKNYDYPVNFKNHMGEIGLGYYRPLTDKFIFEIYSGYGYNRINNQFNKKDCRGNSTLKSSRYYIQPAIGLSTRNVELILSGRFRVVSYADIQFSGSLDKRVRTKYVELNNNPTDYFVEPAFTMRLGGGNVKFQFQIGFAVECSRSILEYDPLNVNFGLIFSFNGKE